MGREVFKWTAKAAGGTDARRFIHLLERVRGRLRLGGERQGDVALWVSWFQQG